MNRLAIAGTVFGLLLTLGAWQLPASTYPTQPNRQLPPQALTPAANGPYHVAGNQIIDSQGRPYLMRGTQLPEFRPEKAAYNNRAGADYGAHSATSLSAIRLRFNMNAVRLPLNVGDGGGAAYLSELAKVVRRANDVDLLVILAAREPGAAMPTTNTLEFWSRAAAYFKDFPNVIFDAFSDPSPSGESSWKQGMQDIVKAIRTAGARQPVVVMSGSREGLFEGPTPAALIDDANMIYEVSPRYANNRTDVEREEHFGLLASRVPVLANGMDLNIADKAECSAIPSDPSAASELVQSNLNYFDAHQISWTISEFEPGKLIKDLSFHDATTLENGWTCGHAAYPYAGLGRIVEGHLRSSEERGLFVVSASGGLEVSRGGFALAYGPVMADQDSNSTTRRAPTTLGRISVQVTDALGVTRPAGMLWASAGWGQVNFVIPKDSAVGPARMTIVRKDGSSISASITVADTVPGFVTGHSCRGAAIGLATQVFKNGRSATSQLSACKGIECSTIAVPLTKGATTRVRLSSSGFRNAQSAKNVEVTVGGVRVPVISFGPTDERGTDQLTIEIPASLRGLGETDLISHVNGRVSNAVRIRLGGEKPAS